MEQTHVHQIPAGPSARFPILSFVVVDEVFWWIQRAAYQALSNLAQRKGKSTPRGKALRTAFERSRRETPHVETYFDPCTQDFVQVCTCGVEQRIFFSGSIGAHGFWTDVEPGLSEEILSAWPAFRADHRACAPVNSLAGTTPTSTTDEASILAAPDLSMPVRLMPKETP